MDLLDPPDLLEARILLRVRTHIQVVRIDTVLKFLCWVDEGASICVPKIDIMLAHQYDISLEAQMTISWA